MDEGEVVIIQLILRIVGTVVCVNKANELNRSIRGWGFFGLVLPIIGMIWIRFMKPVVKWDENVDIYKKQEKTNKAHNENIVENKELNLLEAMIPVILLMLMLAYNIFYKDGAWLGDYSNQIILLVGGFFAAIVGLGKKTTLVVISAEIYENLKSVFVPIMILFLVGALAGTWLVSGIIPSMVYYGLQVLSPSIFLPASVIIAAIISIATGSSWTTSATVGIALIGIGTALGIPVGMIAGAVDFGCLFWR